MHNLYHLKICVVKIINHYKLFKKKIHFSKIYLDFREYFAQVSILSYAKFS